MSHETAPGAGEDVGRPALTLFGMDTAPGTVEPAAWHAEVDAYIAEH